MKKKLGSLVGLAVGLSPIMALAQTTTYGNLVTCGTVNNIGDVLCRIATILNTIIPVLIVLGVVYFIWGVVQYVIGGDEEAKTAGRDKMIYGVIGLVVIVGLWGLVAIVRNTFGLSNAQSITLPTVPFQIQ